MPANTTHASQLVYGRYLDHLAKAKNTAGLPTLEAEEEDFLAHIYRITSQGQPLGVVAAMWLKTGRSSSTNFRVIKKLKREGWITINAGEEDERTKWIEVSKLGLRYFSLHEKSMLKALSKAA